MRYLGEVRHLTGLVAVSSHRLRIQVAGDFESGAPSPDGASCRSNPDSTPHSAERAGGQPRSVQAESRTASSECWSLDMIRQLPGARR